MAIDTAQPNGPKVARSPAELDVSALKLNVFAGWDLSGSRSGFKTEGHLDTVAKSDALSGGAEVRPGVYNRMRLSQNLAHWFDNAQNR